MKNKKTWAETPKYSHQMPSIILPLPDLDEQSRETYSAPIYRKAMEGVAPKKKRLIDANAISYTLENEPGGWGGEPQYIVTKEEIAKMPTVDAVEVVRCKDCKHWEDGYLGYCTNSHTAMDYDTFCSYGERRDPA